MDSSIEDFKKSVQENRNNFKQNAPFSVEKSAEHDNIKSLEKLQEFKQQCAELRLIEEEMKPGLDIFEYDALQYTELTLVERENQLLNEMWELKEDWDNEWSVWKDLSFGDLKIDDMDEIAVEFTQRLGNMNKDVRHWPIYDFLKIKFLQFRDTMPLISDLRDESMRPRHWNELRFEVKEEFNEQSDEFTLEKIFELDLVKHANFIDELANSAKKQLKIEKGLQEIKRIWEEDPAANLEIVKDPKPDGEVYYKITGTENIIQLIEEHSALLATFKSSPYYKQFNEKIDLWENNIASITETLEVLMAVQG